MESTSARLSRLREKKGLSPDELCEKLGLDITEYAGWESGGTLPDTDSAAKLASFYGITQTELIYGKDGRLASMTIFPKDTKKEYSPFSDIRIFICAVIMFVGLGGILYMIMAAVAAGNTGIPSIFGFAKASFSVFGAMTVLGAAVGGVILIKRSKSKNRKKK